jgi:hypothetical protein
MRLAVHIDVLNAGDYRAADVSGQQVRNVHVTTSNSGRSSRAPRSDWGNHS